MLMELKLYLKLLLFGLPHILIVFWCIFFPLLFVWIGYWFAKRGNPHALFGSIAGAVTAALIIGYGIWGFLFGSYGRDPQGGLIMIFAPFYGGVIGLIIAGCFFGFLKILFPSSSLGGLNHVSVFGARLIILACAAYLVAFSLFELPKSGYNHLAEMGWYTPKEAHKIFDWAVSHNENFIFYGLSRNNDTPVDVLVLIPGVAEPWVSKGHLTKNPKLPEKCKTALLHKTENFAQICRESLATGK